jgi:hypothetical protein
MRPHLSSPLALEAPPLVTKHLHLVQGAGEGLDDAITMRVALAILLDRQATFRRLRGRPSAIRPPHGERVGERWSSTSPQPTEMHNQPHTDN